MTHQEIIKTEKKHREKFLNTYYDTDNIYELQRAIVKYFKALNKVLDKIEKS